MNSLQEYEHIVKEIKQSFKARSVVLLVLGGEALSGFYALLDKGDKRAMVNGLRELADKIDRAVDLGPTTMTR